MTAVMGAVLLPGRGGSGSASAVLGCGTAVAPGAELVEAVVRREGCAALLPDCHLRARPGGSQSWAQLADVLVGPDVGRCSRRRALVALGELRRRCPGALVTVVPYGDRRCAVRLGSGLVLLLAPAPGWPERARLPSAALASLLHAWLAAGVPPQALAPAVVETVRYPSAGGGLSRAGGLRGRVLIRPLAAQDGSPPSRSTAARSASGGRTSRESYNRVASP